MLPVHKDDLTNLALEFKMTDTQRATLVAFVQQEGFDIMQKLMEEEIRLIHAHHMNVDIADKARQEATFVLAKAAGMFYSGLMQRIDEQLNLHKYQATKLGTLEHPEPSPDITE